MRDSLCPAEAAWSASLSIGRVLMVASAVLLGIMRLANTWELNRLALRVVHKRPLSAPEAWPSAASRNQAMAALGYAQLGQGADAIRILRPRLSDTSARQPLWAFQVGTMLLETGQPAEAVQVWQDNHLMDVLISHCKSATRDRARESADFWCSPLSYLEQDSEALCAHGIYNDSIGALDASLQDFRNAEEQSDALSTTCLYHYARTLDRLGHHAEALGRYKAAFEIEPDSSYLRGMGHALMQLGQYDAALQVLHDAYGTSRSDRERSEAARLLGFVYYRLGMLEDARLHLQEAVFSFGSADPSAYLYLARTRHRLGDTEEAAEAYRQAVSRLGPRRDLIWYRYELAELLLELGKDAEAKEVYREILDIIPGDQNALEALRDIGPEGGP